MKKIKLRLEEQYLSYNENCSKVIKEAIEKYDVILITAPQGTGKTTWIKETFEEKAKVISPTRALTNQINSDNEYVFDYWGDYIAYSETFVQGLNMLKEASDVKYVVIDEIHKLVSYNEFAYVQVISFNKVYEYCKEHNIKVILLTATPQTLASLQKEQIYKDIGVHIEIEKNRKYVNEVYFTEKYSVKMVTDLIYTNHIDGFMQIAMITDTKDIETIKDNLIKKGLNKVFAISSKNRKEEENIEMFKSICKNELLDIDVLLVTTWADVGVNFINTNINNLYFFATQNYEKSDLTTLVQFIARTRNCIPNLYVNYPTFTNDEKKLIKFIAKQANKQPREIVNSIKEDGEDSVYFKKILELRNQACENALKCYDMGLYNENIFKCYGIKGIIYDSEKYVLSSVSIYYNSLKILEKCIMFESPKNLLEYVHGNNIEECKLDKTSFGQLTEEQHNQVKELLLYWKNNRIEFNKQTEMKQEITKITKKKNVQMKRVVNYYRDELGIELKQRKSSGKTIYSIVSIG